MTLNYLRTSIYCALALTGACSSSDGGGGDSSSGTGEPGTGAASTDTGVEPVVTGSDTGEPTSTGSDSGSDTGSDSGSDDSGSGDSGSDDTGPALPVECDEADPTVSSAFLLTLDAWAPDPNPSVQLDVGCVVESIDHQDGMVNTALTCEVDGAPAPAIVSIADSLEGPVDWAAGDPVQLGAEVWDEGDFGSGRNVQLRTPDGELLLCAGEGLMDMTFVQRCAPLKVTVADACPGSIDGRRRLDFESADGATSVFHGHRGVLSISLDTAFAIEVEQAQHTTEHDGDELRVLVRRVKLSR